MISVSFVNNNNPPLRINNLLIDISNTINENALLASEYVNDFKLFYEERIINEAVGLESTDTDELKKKKEGFFEKIGNLALAIFKKIQDLINTVINGVKDILYRLSPLEKKIEILKKENPDLANKIIAKIDAGDLTPTDIKNLKEVSKLYDEVLKEAEKSNVDPKSLKGRIEAVKKKIDSFDESTTRKAIGAAAVSVSLIGGILALKKWGPEFIKVNNEANKTTQDLFDRTMKAYASLRARGRLNEVINRDLSVAENISNIHNYTQGFLGKVIQIDVSKQNRLIRLLKNTLSSFKYGNISSEDYFNKLELIIDENNVINSNGGGNNP